MVAFQNYILFYSADHTFPYTSLSFQLNPEEILIFHFPSPIDHSILWSFLYNPINKLFKI
ncbi:hypothetical protein ACRRTK_000004 [Alexandromys fortis]